MKVEPTLIVREPDNGTPDESLIKVEVSVAVVTMNASKVVPENQRCSRDPLRIS